jgi:integrase
LKLTQAAIAKLTLPEGKAECFFWDDSMPGFGLRIRGEHRTYVAQYKIGKQQRRVTLGNASKVTLDAARTGAKQIFSGVTLGSDPQADKAAARSRATLDCIIAAYLEAAEKRQRPSTFWATKFQLNELWSPLHRFAVDQISLTEIAARLRVIAKERGPVSANRSRDTLSAMFAWAIGEGLCMSNPVIGCNKQVENDPRERTLTDTEVGKLWLSLADSDYGRIIRLILLTGCRREEIASLQWSEVDFEARTITLPKERTKNKQQHVVPLSDAAMQVLQDIPHRDRTHVFGKRVGGFSAWSKSKRELDAVLNIEPWVLHDLRRTVRTGLGKLGVQPHIGEAALNHLPAKLIRTYDKNKYEAEKRAALEQWANHIAVAVAQAEGTNVVRLSDKTA